MLYMDQTNKAEFEKVNDCLLHQTNFDWMIVPRESPGIDFIYLE